MSSPPRDDSVWTVVRAELAEAPRNTRRRTALALAGFRALIVLALVDLLTGFNPREAYRLASTALAAAGLGLLGLSQGLGRACGRAGVASLMRNVGARRPVAFERILLALPGLALMSAVLLAVAAGLLVPGLAHRPGFLLPFLAVYGLYLVAACRTVLETSRFLYHHAEEQAQAAERARAAAAESQLAALQAQLNPHFLFNALNTVAALVRTRPPSAERTIEHLADVLRRTLDRSRRTRATVREEVEYLRAYLAIEQERWGDRLRVDWDIQPGAATLSLPPLTLQPLVENALKHGLGARLEGARCGSRPTGRTASSGWR